MGLCGKEAKQMQLKCEGNLIFDLIAYCPYELSKLSPQIHGCDLVEGQWGTVDAIIQWTFKVDDKTVFAKERIIALDEENKTIQFKTIEGQLLEAYKNCTITVQSSNNSISASFEFEKKNECMPNPQHTSTLLTNSLGISRPTIKPSQGLLQTNIFRVPRLDLL